MQATGKIFCTGTMRTGSSLVGNMLSVHPDIQVFAEKVHFFRFVYGRYDPLTPASIERALHHIRLRWRYRFSLDFDVEPILAAMVKRGPSYAALYDEIMRSLGARAGRPIWAENVAFHWRDIPTFVSMFEDSKAIHVYRDLRGVLASWRKMTFAGGNLYLNAIFNWIDSINHMVRFRQSLPADRYLPVRFEDVHADPRGTCQRICGFLNIEFQEVMVQPERWEALFNSDFVGANVSSYTGEKVYGFDPARAGKWRDVLERWEIALAEFLAYGQLKAGGYEPTLTTYDADEMRAGFAKLVGNPFLFEHLQVFQATGEGNNRFPTDPTEARSWAAPDGFGRFSDTPAYQRYQDDLEDVERRLKAKYPG